MSEEKNPFDALGLDPTLSAAELTQKLQREAQRMPQEEREKTREIWRRLTLNDVERAQLALFAHPRGPEASADSFEVLRAQIKAPSGSLEPPPLRAQLFDALLDLQHEENTPASPIPDALRPDPGFSRVSAEALSCAGHDDNSTPPSE